MRSVSALTIAAATVLAPAPLLAQRSDSTGVSISVTGGDSVSHVVRRLDPRHAAFAIVTTDGRATLLLMDTVVVAQLTDRGLDGVDETVDRETKADTGGLISRVLTGALLGALRPMLDHGIAWHLRDLGEAEYAEPRLVLRSRAGKEVFAGTTIEGRPLMESFHPADARAFAARARAARARLH